MIAAELRDKYLPTIGIECHVQFNTRTKIFSAVNNDARNATPNSLISPLCLGLPGTLPVLNQAVVDAGITAGLALNAKIATRMKFDRKHYFYPDLPKGYQITQFDEPIVGEGWINIQLSDGTTQKVGIERAHLEEDAGKSTHPTGADHSLVDLNRAGTPLLEIVSKPDMHSAEAARAYAHELYLIMKYTKVSNVDLFQGNMRFDINVSVAPHGQKTLGTRAEVKNLNSFKSIERATQYEIDRQIELLEKGQAIVQETRGWDDAKQKTLSQRSKEDAHDYRYFPEPDIPPYEITEEEIEAARQSMPKLPQDYRDQLQGVVNGGVEVVDLLLGFDFADLVWQINTTHPKLVSRITGWLITDIPHFENNMKGKRTNVTSERLIALAQKVEEGAVSHSAATKVLAEVYVQGGDPEELIASMGLEQVSDHSALEAIVDEILAANPQAAEDVKAGEGKAIGFLVGQVMKASRGSANPKLVNEILQNKLS